MSRLLIVSNRLPVTAAKSKDTITFQHSVGGVATGIASLEQPSERIWFGWPGIAKDRLNEQHKLDLARGLEERGCRAVHLSARDIRDFYFGFSNDTIWPLFHYFTQYVSFDTKTWDSYQHVNQQFCDEIVKVAREDDHIWIHDYQLMLLPEMLRKRLPNATIGFFLHIPFPSFELIRLLPWRSEILEGLLGADLIGFHEYDYVRHFLSSVYRILGFEPHLNQFMAHNRIVQVDAFPMGIDYEKFAFSKDNEQVRREITKIKKRDNIRVIVSVDRLDYTKGILKRLEAYDLFLSKYPQYQGKVTLVVIAVPSRAQVEVYKHLRREIEQTVGRINGAYGTLDWTPVSYMYRSLPFEQLAAFYSIADAALITPLRDGMNLVAKEFVACQHEKEHQGILILSEMAGAACELAEAIVINPHDKEKIVAALEQAMEMPQEERKRRNEIMLGRLSRYTVRRWAGDFIHRLEDIKHKQAEMTTRRINTFIRNTILTRYREADRRLLLLDYDGTLTGFVKDPAKAGPDEELLSILTRLTADERNEVVVISGRDRDTLIRWLGDLKLNLVSEHGAFIREYGQDWRTTVPNDNEWKTIIRPVLELYVDRTPGAFVEEKTYSLVWHCRKSDPGLAKLRIQELKDAIVAMTTNLNIGVFEGNKIIEVKLIGVNKGVGIQTWLARENWPFILAAGDDYTDEDMFGAVPEGGFTCKIGLDPSRAQYRLNNVEEFRALLGSLIES